MNLLSRLQRAEKSVPVPRGTLEELDAKIIRGEMEHAVEKGIVRRVNGEVVRIEIEFDGDVKVKTEEELLKLLDFPSLTAFQDDQRCWLSLQRRNQGLPCIGSEFGGPALIDPKTPEQWKYFLSDVTWHLRWLQRQGFESSLSQAVALYTFCQRHSRDCIDPLLDAFNELQAEGEVFSDWDHPEISVSEAVVYFYDENQKALKASNPNKVPSREAEPLRERPPLREENAPPPKVTVMEPPRRKAGHWSGGEW